VKDSKKKTKAKTAYTQPKLFVFGPVGALTQAGSAGGMGEMGMSMGMDMGMGPPGAGLL
jgi:hypothetical protein